MVPHANRNFVCLSVLVESLGTAKTRNVRSPVRGYVRRMDVVVDVAVDADNIVKGAIQGTDITGATVTLTTGETAGLGKGVEPSAANYVERGQALQAITDGGGGAGQATVTFLIETD